MNRTKALTIFVLLIATTPFLTNCGGDPTSRTGSNGSASATPTPVGPTLLSNPPFQVTVNWNATSDVVLSVKLPSGTTVSSSNQAESCIYLATHPNIASGKSHAIQCANRQPGTYQISVTNAGSAEIPINIELDTNRDGNGNMVGGATFGLTFRGGETKVCTDDGASLGC
jgi:hypothetical protein